MDCTPACRHATAGFTLVELSIVLVIIGLLIGGIFVGRDLISAGKNRQQVSQLDKYDAAVNSFRDKYMGLPGDLAAATATGFTMTARSGAAGHGDNNRMIEGCSAGALVAGCETVLFWKDLAFAGLVEGTYSGTDALAQMTSTTRDSYLPKGALDQSSVTVFSTGNMNYYQLTGVSSTDAAGVYTLINVATPLQATSLDTKVDDGLPASGVVRAMEGTGPLNTAAVAGAATCVSNVAGNPYNTVTQAYAETILCQLRVQFR